MSDRLEEIHATRAQYGGIISGEQVDWLIAEVERLRPMHALYPDHDGETISRLADENVALRGALQALVDATAPVTAITYSLMSIHDTSWEDFDAARAVAVGLLSQQEAP